MRVKLNHKAKNQRNNRYQPNSTCNVTALSNALGCLGIDVSPDELFIKSNSKEYQEWAIKRIGLWVKDFIGREKLNQVWKVLEKLSKEYAPGSWFQDNWLSFDDIKLYLSEGCPILVSGSFTHGGHIVCIAGYDELLRSFIVDDSWGNWNTGYKSHNCDDNYYKFKALENVLKGKNGKYRALVVSL